MARRNNKFKKQQKVEKRLEVENLDRFAGSSDEEDRDDDIDHDEEVHQQQKRPQKQGRDDASSDGDDGDSDEEDEGTKQVTSGKGGRSNKEAADSDSDDDNSSDVEKRNRSQYKTRVVGDGHEGDLEESEDSESESDSESEEEGDDDKDNGPAAKMADAMARILGTGIQTKQPVGKKTSTVPVILSKTTTPLQRQALEEKKQLKELKEKRQANRERNLSALHIPLSVATTVNIVDNDKSNQNKDSSKLSSITEELEQERLHRRVATRGVVALFNAISQHQKGHHGNNDSDDDDAEKSSSLKRKKDSTTKLTKHGFLEKLKTTAAAAAASKDKMISGTSAVEGSAKSIDTHDNRKSTEAKKETRAKPQWNALKDDFMLNPKKVCLHMRVTVRFLLLDSYFRSTKFHRCFYYIAE